MRKMKFKSAQEVDATKNAEESMAKRPTEPAISKPSKKRVGLKYLTAEETDRFMSAVTDERDKLIFLIMLRQGLRVGEVVGELLDYWTKNGHRCKNGAVPKEIMQSDLNADVPVGKDKFRHTVQELEGIHIEDIDWTEKRLLVRGKGDKSRFIPLRPEVMQALNDYIKPGERKPEERMGAVFGIDPPTVRYHATQYAKAASIGRRVHPHIFRHTFAVNYLKMGGSIRALQKMLGHNSLAMTERYLELVEKDIADDIAKVDMREDMLKNPEQAKKEMAQKIANALTGGV